MQFQAYALTGIGDVQGFVDRFRRGFLQQGNTMAYRGYYATHYPTIRLNGEDHSLDIGFHDDPKSIYLAERTQGRIILLDPRDDHTGLAAKLRTEEEERLLLVDRNDPGRALFRALEEYVGDYSKRSEEEFKERFSRLIGDMRLPPSIHKNWSN
jgi:hypothetical protein